MSRENFWHICQMIHDDPIFVNPGKKPQRPVKFQLAAFLCRAGALGALKSAGITSVAEGTVYLYVDRVSKALRRLRPRYLKWPTRQERAMLKDEMGDWGFPGCVGIADGTLLPLREKPRENGWSFWSRKKFYAVRFHHFLSIKSHAYYINSSSLCRLFATTVRISLTTN